MCIFSWLVVLSGCSSSEDQTALRSEAQARDPLSTEKNEVFPLELVPHYMEFLVGSEASADNPLKVYRDSLGTQPVRVELGVELTPRSGAAKVMVEKKVFSVNRDKDETDLTWDQGTLALDAPITFEASTGDVLTLRATLLDKKDVAYSQIKPFETSTVIGRDQLVSGDDWEHAFGMGVILDVSNPEGSYIGNETHVSLAMALRASCADTAEATAPLTHHIIEPTSIEWDGSSNMLAVALATDAEVTLYKDALAIGTGSTSIDPNFKDFLVKPKEHLDVAPGAWSVELRAFQQGDAFKEIVKTAIKTKGWFGHETNSTELTLDVHSSSQLRRWQTHSLSEDNFTVKFRRVPVCEWGFKPHPK